MRYHEILRLLTEEPLLITPAAHSSILSLFRDHATLEAAEFRSKREGVDMCGEAVDLPEMSVTDGGVAVIPVIGPLGIGFGKFEKGAGATDCADVTADINEAEDNSMVRAMLLYMDTPGGMHAGTPELADRILQVEKPIYSFSPGQMCSAGYWLGCATDGVFATKSSAIGGIGVYSSFLDSSERMKAAGLKMEVIASGKYKGAGMPGTPLSDDHRAQMQQRVHDLAQMFYDHVTSCRGEVSQEDMQGQVFHGQQAAQKGLIDATVSSLDDVLRMLS